MLPDVTELLGVEYYRDGGSLGVCFADRAGTQFELFLRCRLDAGHRRVGYADPELQRHVPHAYTSKLDGGQLQYHTREDTPLAWEDAEQLLARLAPLLDAADPDAADLFPLVQHVVAHRGAS